MREFKFRAWHVPERKMINEESFNSYFSYAESAELNFWLDNENICIPLQYTGLKDKNGKEIYEGDILARDDMAYRRKVIYCPIRAAFILQDENETYFHSSLKYIVLGNIYENPELMEKKE